MSFNAKTGYSEDHKDCFEILINEAQRAFIEAALREYNPPCFEKEDREELTMLHDMFKDLPTEDNTWLDPSDGKRKLMTHGFCL